MPIYEYRCTACNADFEKIQKVDADAPGCPQCGAADAQRRVSLSSFHLKGTGWYSTDYKSSTGSATGAASKSGGESSASESAPASSGHTCGSGCGHSH